MRPRSTQLLVISVATFWTAAAVTRAQATASELIHELGRPLLAYANASSDEGLRTLVVNGARLRMRTGSTLDSIDAVLDRQRQECATHEPLVRTRTKDQGFLGCVVPQYGRGIIERLSGFAKTGDLAELGELRVTWVMQEGDGVRYVAMASEGTLELARAFPTMDDAPGIDIAELPRPAQAQRIVSTWQEGAEPLLVSYRSALALDALDAQYTNALGTAGLAVERAPKTTADERALVIRRGEHVHLAMLARDGDGTLISIIPLASDATQAQPAR